MKAIVKKLNDNYYATTKFVNAGDLVINNDEVIEVDQSTCVFYDHKIEGIINPLVEVYDGEIIEILFKCAKESECGYPFCSGGCMGNKGFYVLGKEDRGY